MVTNVDVERNKSGHATGNVRILLRVEAFAILAASATLFFLSGGELWVFAALFFAPDLSLIGFLVSKKVGAAFYNAVHSYALHAVLGIAGFVTGTEIFWQIALILVAHAAFDRSLGYGLKYAAGFGHTHLGRIGKPASGDG
jgi:hypothetical protein